MSDLMNIFRVFFPSSFSASGLIIAFAFLICLFGAQSAQAQLTLTVTRNDDRNATCLSGVDCSLREAVNAANAAGTNDTINFAIPAGDAGCTSGICTITLTLGEVAVNSPATAGTLTITNSTGANNLLISGNNAGRVFFVNSGANLTISGVTITKGNGLGTALRTNDSGGGIINNGGELTLTNSIVSGNTADFGGGITTNGGTLNLTNSTVSGNTADYGGGITNLGGKLNLTNSIVSGNTTDIGGGGILNSGFTTLTNSIVSGNTASGSRAGGGDGNGGGILIGFGTLNLTSVTVTQNNSTSTTCTNCAGGITNSSGTANLKNTIVAGNTVANEVSSPDFLGAIAAGSSFNLIGNGLGTTGISNADANSNQVGSSASPIDPRLGALTNNGGATQTHALPFGSPAIDKGFSFGLMTDQRGFARPVNLDDTTYPNAAGGDGSDIGAFELGAAAKRRKRVRSPIQ